MSAETKSQRRSVDHPYWYGMLCAENVEAFAERMRRMLDGKFYTFVTANSYNENSDRFSAIDVRTACRLVAPLRVSKAPDWCSVSFTDQSYVWGLHTRAKTEQEARAGGIHDRVQLTFNDSRHRGESLTIDHYAPAGYRLQWIVAVEDHDSERDYS